MITLQVPTPLSRNNYLLVPNDTSTRKRYMSVVSAQETGIIIPILYVEDITPDMLLVPVYSHAGIDICIDVNNRYNFYLGNLDYLNPKQVLVSTRDLVGLSTHPVAQDEILVFQE